jgi:hypothetical protein
LSIGIFGITDVGISDRESIPASGCGRGDYATVVTRSRRTNLAIVLIEGEGIACIAGPHGFFVKRTHRKQRDKKGGSKGDRSESVQTSFGIHDEFPFRDRLQCDKEKGKKNR